MITLSQHLKGRLFITSEAYRLLIYLRLMLKILYSFVMHSFFSYGVTHFVMHSSLLGAFEPMHRRNHFSVSCFGFLWATFLAVAQQNKRDTMPIESVRLPLSQKVLTVQIFLYKCKCECR